MNKFISSVGYLTARENEVELLATTFYNLHIIDIEKFQEKSVCVVVSLLYCFMPFVQCGYLYCLCCVIFLLFYFHDK